MKYMELIPNVKWNCPSNNNINILIMCHPQQTPYYLSQVEDFIWERFSNITIWRLNADITDRYQLLKEVEQMDAVICFITELLISSPNEIGDYLLPAVIEKKFPLLPIVDGENLEEVFDQRYGHIHFVKCMEKRKLRFDVIEKFVMENQASEEKRNQWFELPIRSVESFSQSYFISYRKVDGKYIDYIQRKIHEETNLVDTQLWYDSYLVPGENYDANLLKIIEKCSAVLLLVTPHLLEPNNYILRIEIPFAKKCGKPVIGIMMEKTDLQAIRDLYGVEKVYKLEEWTSFSHILSDAKLPIPSVDSYPSHLFDLAKAYMEGRDVERNMKIACELFYQAARYLYMPAYEKLIEIKTGEYEECCQKYEDSIMSIIQLTEYLNEIEDHPNPNSDSDDWIEQLFKLSDDRQKEKSESYVNYDEVVSLFEEYITILEDRYEQWRTERNFIPLLDYLRKYGEFYLKQGRLDEAVTHLQKFYEFVKDLDKQGANKLLTYLSVASLLLAKAYNALEDYDNAEKYYRKSVDTDRMLNDDDSTYNSITYTNLLTSLCEFGDFCQKRGKLLKAKIMYQEVLETIQNNGTIYGMDWEPDRVFNGYEDEDTSRKTEELSRFARISLWEIETELLKIGKFRPTVKVYSRDKITDTRILECCDKDEIQLLSHEIMINSIAKISWLTDYLAGFGYEFDICQNKVCMDAKNLMAVMTLDINDTCELIVHTMDTEFATEILQEISAKLND